MNEALWALLAGLVGVALLHAASRVGGALATAAWCVAALVFGWFAFAEREGGLVFLGVTTPKWTYFVVVGGVAVVQIGIAARALRRRVAAADDDSKSG